MADSPLVSHEVFRSVSFPFADDKFPPNLGAVVQRTVADGSMPALTVIHDTDGDWSVLDGINDPNLPDACGVYAIARIAETDPALAEMAALAPGFAAYRDSADEPWIIEPFQYEDAE